MAREYYSIPEAAALLGLSRIAVFKRVKAGRMSALRFGRNWAVPASELERMGLGAVVKPSAHPPVPEGGQAAGGAADAEMDSMGWD
ncbi:MAG: helix-turn-helix domain-containing protein [Elusimicrobiales bacterium]